MNGDGRLETRTAQGTFRTEFRNSDILQVQASDGFEYLPRPFSIFGTLNIPSGEYRSANVRAQYDIGAQRRVSGSVAYEKGQFYGGTKDSLAYSAGRVVLSRKLAIEPSISLNRVDIPQGAFVAKVITARTIYAFTPRMFAGALVSTTRAATHSAPTFACAGNTCPGRNSSSATTTRATPGRPPARLRSPAARCSSRRPTCSGDRR
ncbi:MAG: hypothetical protein IT176_00740 [Acidobacteria bacterium]|nr:hypothetical protein [Acidobacteriota bacterium]